MPTKIIVNGQEYETQSTHDTPLLWVLRDELGLTGTKFGCGEGRCGACTVLVEGEAVRSCITPLLAAEGRAITTIEGLAPPGEAHPLQTAWMEQQVAQCGYCQPGMIMTAAALLAQYPYPTYADFDLAF